MIGHWGKLLHTQKAKRKANNESVGAHWIEFAYAALLYDVIHEAGWILFCDFGSTFRGRFWSLWLEYQSFEIASFLKSQLFTFGAVLDVSSCWWTSVDKSCSTHPHPKMQPLGMVMKNGSAFGASQLPQYARRLLITDEKARRSLLVCCRLP